MAPYARLLSSSLRSFRLAHQLTLRQMATLPKGISVLNGKFDLLPSKVQDFVCKKIELCSPADLHICDGSATEAQHFTNLLVEHGTAHK